MIGQPLLRFVRRLALEVGRADFGRFSEEIDIEDVVGWLAFWHLEPFGDHWRRSARTAVTVAGALGKLSDEAEAMFMPNWDAEEHVQSDEEMKAILAAVPQFREQMVQQGIL